MRFVTRTVIVVGGAGVLVDLGDLDALGDLVAPGDVGILVDLLRKSRSPQATLAKRERRVKVWVNFMV